LNGAHQVPTRGRLSGPRPMRTTAAALALGGLLWLSGPVAGVTTARSLRAGARYLPAAGQHPSPMHGFVERSRGDFTAFMPPGWLMTASQSGTDITSPTGVAVASFAYATEDPGPSTDASVLAFTLRSLGFSGVHLLRQSRPYAYGASVRQVSELVGYRGGVSRHAILSVEVFNNYAQGSFGFDANLQMAPVPVWGQYKATLRLIADHIYFLGHVPPEVQPGHCGLDPSDTAC
jgi:hypothetical protein